jgi:branched-chain amino acid aminotransferase
MKGRIIPISEASIPINDWGLVHSDITYDVVPVWNGSFFRIDDYLDRFEASMAALRLDPKINRKQIKGAITAMVIASELRESYVAMVCSRGTPQVAGSRDPRDCLNHFYAWCVPYVHVIKPDIAKIGASALIATGVKRIPCDSVNPIIKNYHWGDFTQGLFEAKDNNYETVILTDQNENITEGPGFNVFCIKNGLLVTSDHGVLEGISRKTVLEIAASLGLNIQVRDLPVSEFLEADEVFISTSGGGVIPLVKVNNTIFANGTCGPVTHKIYRTYWDWFKSPKYQTRIEYK